MIFENNQNVDKIYSKTKSLLTNKRSKKSKADAIIKVSYLWQNLENIGKGQQQGLSFTNIDPKILDTLSVDEINAVYNDLKETFKGSKKKSKKKKLLIFQNLINKNKKFLQLINILYRQAPVPPEFNEQRMRELGWNTDEDNSDEPYQTTLAVSDSDYQMIDFDEYEQKENRHQNLMNRISQISPKTNIHQIRRRNFTDWQEMEEKEDNQMNVQSKKVTGGWSKKQEKFIKQCDKKKPKRKKEEKWKRMKIANTQMLK